MVYEYLKLVFSVSYTILTLPRVSRLGEGIQKERFGYYYFVTTVFETLGTIETLCLDEDPD